MLCCSRSTSSQFPSGITIFHDSRLSTQQPQMTACLPPALDATLPPIVQAHRLVGSVANTWGLAASITRPVTAPAPAVMVGTCRPLPMFFCSTAAMASSFSTLIITALSCNGTDPPQRPVPPPRGITTRPSLRAARISPGSSPAVSGDKTQKGW